MKGVKKKFGDHILIRQKIKNKIILKFLIKKKNALKR